MISAALRSLDIDDYVLVAGSPTNETEFLASFRKVVGKDATDTVILSSDPSTFGVTWAQVAPKLAELQATYDAQAYARSRKEEYPPLEDQLDHIYHNGIASWKANMVKPVKDKYPKP